MANSPKNTVNAPLLPTRQDFEHTFDPESYLEEYFNGLDDEDRFTTQFIVSALRKMPEGLVAHEFGGGPTLYSVAALAARAREIHFSDCVRANLDQVQCWLNDEPDAFDWRPYIGLTLEAEGILATPAAVAQRAADMRRRVTRLMVCDAQAALPLGETIKYDLVAAHHCTDVAATNVAGWIQVLRNISTLIVPGGWLLVSVTTGANLYTVGQNKFRCVDLTPEDVYQGYVAAGYDSRSLYIETKVVPDGREYSGIVMAVGRHL
jgi:hypothetical protein